jgi:hypothetical protein
MPLVCGMVPADVRRRWVLGMASAAVPASGVTAGVLVAVGAAQRASPPVLVLACRTGSVGVCSGVGVNGNAKDETVARAL